MNVIEGYMPYRGYKTYYRIVGECKDNKKPLVLLHGGPGSTHNYFEVLDRLADEGRAIIFYDQLGCGNSYVEGHPELWCSDTWDNELIELRKHLKLDEVHLLGQSWGGMLAIEYLCDYKPEGIKSVILSSTLPAAELWAHEQHRLIKLMSKEDQEAI
ncbi:MAG TPA: alpha/beta hydrolase, partial [Lachnospiraceae bacterium]|nr:alpha/beta hydrolase [Lachnospiraceae bacterium]